MSRNLAEGSPQTITVQFEVFLLRFGVRRPGGTKHISSAVAVYINGLEQ